MKEFNLIATATFGLEAIVDREVRNLGYRDTKVENGKVTYKGDKLAICRSNLWLRTAERVFIQMGQFEAMTFDELFEKAKAIPWEDVLPKDACFPVLAKAVKSTLMSVPDCQAIVKKAIVERLKQTYDIDWFPEDGATYTVEVGMLNDIATITLDTSGAGLHRRGYRELGVTAPIKETLAAGLINISYWNKDRPLIDPLCGSGTIPIEAALIARNIAPGLKREFASEKWEWMPKKLWDQAKEEAMDTALWDFEPWILGQDIDGRMLTVARHNAELAGVGDCVSFQTQPVQELQSSRKYGCIITNPPYGERLNTRDVQQLYKDMGEVFKPLDTWSIYVLTSDEEFEKLYGKKASRKRKLYNGRIKVDYYQYFGPPPPRRK